MHRGKRRHTLYYPENEEVLENLRRQFREREAELEAASTMAEPDTPQKAHKSLKDYAVPPIDGIHSSIRRPPIQANNFEIKPGTIQMIQTAVQFNGLPSEDPNAHIMNFLEICDTFKFNGVSDDAIRLRLFPFTLRDKAKGWLNSLPAGSITTWADLAQKFLEKFFPPSKTSRLRNDILLFAQYDSESMYEVWERYKDLLRRCPHHNIPDWLQVQTFYNGLTNNLRSTVDAAAGGAFMNKGVDEAYQLLEDMAANNYQWNTNRQPSRRVAGIHEVDAVSALSAQVAALKKQLETKATISHTCDTCGGAHSTERCTFTTKDVQYVGQYNRPQQNNP